jgi:hypothetical protein
VDSDVALDAHDGEDALRNEPSRANQRSFLAWRPRRARATLAAAAKSLAKGGAERVRWLRAGAQLLSPQLQCLRLAQGGSPRNLRAPLGCHRRD